MRRLSHLAVRIEQQLAQASVATIVEVRGGRADEPKRRRIELTGHIGECLRADVVLHLVGERVTARRMTRVALSLRRDEDGFAPSYLLRVGGFEPDRCAVR